MVAAGLAARHNGRAGAKRSGLVALSAINGARRGQNYLRPNAKGSKPMINRHITQDILRDSMKGWTKKYRTAGDIEDIMKKTIYGRVQFQFASEHFTDDLPWFPVGGSTGGRTMAPLGPVQWLVAVGRPTRVRFQHCETLMAASNADRS